MPEPLSALAAHLRPGRYGAGSDEAPLVIAERRIGALIQIGGWRDGFEAAAMPMLQRLGFAGLGTYDHAATSAAGTAFRTGPERLLLHLVNVETWQAVSSNIDPALTPALDLSHGRTVLAIAGAEAPELLARLLALDFDETAFAPGRFAQSAIGSAPVLVHRLASAGDPCFDLYLPRSYAASLWALIAEAAAPFGYRVAAAA